MDLIFSPRRGSRGVRCDVWFDAQIQDLPPGPGTSILAKAAPRRTSVHGPDADETWRSNARRGSIVREAMPHVPSTEKKPLSPEDIVTERPMGRRSALAALGSSVLGAASLAVGVGHAEAKASDSDPSDPAGRGRTGFTDRDSGPGADGAGRGVCAERGWSDSDPNDPAGRGRGPCR
jgi:hypothetical protein